MNKLEIVDTSGLPEDLLEQAREIQDLKFKEGYMALVSGKVDPGAVKKRPARGGMKVDYIPGWWFIDMANAVWGHKWSTEIDEVMVGSKQIWVRGSVVVKVPGKTVIETRPDGTKIETRVDSVEVRHSQFGSGEIKTKKDSPTEVVDLGDDLKSAATDLMKKCLTQFGFGAQIYGRREELETVTASANQVSIIFKRASNYGISIERLEEIVRGRFGEDKKVDNLTELDNLELLNILDEEGKELLGSKA